MLNNNHADKVIHWIVINYPFLGIKADSPSRRLFAKLIDQCRQSCPDTRPIIVHNQRSKEQDVARRIFEELGDGIEIVKNWGADTSQDWLDGWGYVLDSKVPKEEESRHRIVLLPGDLVETVDETEFFRRLDEFIRYKEKPFLVGDFDSVNPLSIKDLIDTHGTYPLVANWVPDAWRAIRALQIRKPRSEFINIAVPELRQLLQRRVFSHEQTLNMLIMEWDLCWGEAKKAIQDAVLLWHSRVGKFELGQLTDDPFERNYKGAIDQIERTERLLKMVFRDLQGWGTLDRENFRRLVDQYEILDERSTRIRDAARIAIWAIGA